MVTAEAHDYSNGGSRLSREWDSSTTLSKAQGISQKKGYKEY